MEEQYLNLSDKARIDLGIIKKALSVNQHAYADLLAHYKEAVYFMILKMVSDPIEAEVLTIVSFGKAFKKLHLYEPKFAFSTWLFKIATNNTIDFLRKKRASTVSIDTGFTDEYGENYLYDLPSKGLSPEADFIREQKHDILHKVVDHLKPRYKKLVILRYFDELSYEEISQELNIPIGTVKAQLFRAKALLNNILNPTKDNF